MSSDDEDKPGKSLAVSSPGHFPEHVEKERTSTLRRNRSWSLGKGTEHKEQKALAKIDKIKEKAVKKEQKQKEKEERKKEKEKNKEVKKEKKDGKKEKKREKGDFDAFDNQRKGSRELDLLSDSENDTAPEDEIIDQISGQPHKNSSSPPHSQYPKKKESPLYKEMKSRLDAFLFSNSVIKLPGTTWYFYHLSKNEKKNKTYLFFLHGGGLRPEAHFEQLQGLAERYQVLAPWFPVELNDFDDYVAGIVLIMRELEIESAHFYGVSFGALVAHYFLYKHPERVKNIILTHCIPPTEEVARKYEKYIQKVDHVPSWLLRSLVGHMVKTKNDLDHAVPDLNLEEKEFWMSVIKHFGVTKAVLVVRMEAMAEYHQSINFKTEDFRKWNGKMLLIDSDSDEMYMEINPLEKMKALHPNASIYVFEKTKYLVSLIRGKVMVDIVMRFLRDESLHSSGEPSVD